MSVIPALALPSSDPATNRAGRQDLWEQALTTLSAEDRKQYVDSSTCSREVLLKVQEATEKSKELCVEKGLRAYRREDGEEVKIRHVLEKLSVWVNSVMKVVDMGVSMDQSGYVALPWAVIKSVVMVGLSVEISTDVEIFSHIVEGVESVSGIIARYTIIEQLYLQRKTESTVELSAAIKKLYAAILTYLARVKSYLSGNSLKRFGKSLIEAMSKRHDELRTKIDEVDVEKWIKLTEQELHQERDKVRTEHYQSLQGMLSQLNKPIIQVSNQLQDLHDALNKEERKEVFRWMSEIQYKTHQEDLSRDLLQDSGRWLLETQTFIEWGQSSVSSILWLHGIPGSGKTKLVSELVKGFLREESSRTSQIAFFYCARSVAESERGKAREILGAILKQLCSSKLNEPIRAPVAKEFQSRKRKADEDCSELSRLSIEDCTRLIIELTRDNPAIIIIDALDECDETHELLEALHDITRNSTELVKVLLSSRDDVEILLRLEGCREVSITANCNGGDIERFVRSEVHGLIHKNILLDGNVNKDLRRRIIKTLITRAQGMFRWVAMSLETLQQIKYKPDFEQALGRLPSKLSDLYDIVHSQIIEETGFYGRSVAVKTLKWLLCAQRLLTVEELAAAVSLNDEDRTTSLSNSDENTTVSSSESLEDSMRSSTEPYEADELSMEKSTSSENEIIRLCRNLVVLDSKQRVFRFAHQSVREYLLTREEYIIKEQHALVATRCFDIYLAEAWQSYLTSKKIDQDNALKPYARVYWPVHFKFAEGYENRDFDEKVSKFMFCNSAASPAYTQWALDVRSWALDIDPEYEEPNSVLINSALGLDMEAGLGRRLHLVSIEPQAQLGAFCAFGFSSLIKEYRLSSTEYNQPISISDGRYSLLGLASQEGHSATVKMLLDQGADINAKCEDNHRPESDIHHSCTVLKEATSTAQATVIQLLLDSGAYIDSECEKNGTALSLACWSGHTSIVQILLSNGADVNASSGCHGSPLQAAAFSEEFHYPIAHILLENGANVNAQGGDFGNPLQAALFNYARSLVDLLLEKGADVHAEGGRYWNALQAACCRPLFGDSIVRMLLEKGVDVNTQGGCYGNALQAAAVSSSVSMVQILLENGANVNAQGGDFGTALHAASSSNSNEMIEKLLEAGADVNAQGGRRDTPLCEATSTGKKESVELLLQNGANVNAQTNVEISNGNALMEASYGGYDSIVEILLEHGADIDARHPRKGVTCLWFASREGHRSTVELLIEKGANIDPDSDHSTALQIASLRGHRSTVELLIEKGANIDANSDYCTALQIASWRGHESTVQTLLENGADVNVRTLDGEPALDHTALDYARLKGHDSIAKLLLDYGAVGWLELSEGEEGDDVGNESNAHKSREESSGDDNSTPA